MKVVKKIISLGDNPLKLIEWVIAILTFLGGLYIFTPLYSTSVVDNGLSVFAAAMSHPFMILGWGALLLASSLFVIVGLKKNMPQIKSMGWFGIILARFFQLITTFAAVGFLPITWIYPFTVTAVIIILWAFARKEVRANAVN